MILDCKRARLFHASYADELGFVGLEGDICDIACVTCGQLALYDGLAALHSRALRLAKKNAQFKETIDKLFLLTFSARKEATDESDSEDVDDAESPSDALWLEAVCRTDGDSDDSDSFVEVETCLEELECSPRSRTRALPATSDEGCLFPTQCIARYTEG